MQKQEKEEDVRSVRVKRGRARLVGYGLDSDGQVRYTRGDGMELYGGSDKAHAEMQRRALIIREKLASLGISLDSMTYDQYLLAKGVVEGVNAL